jgi:hypothetical protein
MSRAKFWAGVAALFGMALLSCGGLLALAYRV